MNLTPNSWGSLRLCEFNACHSPARPGGGQFCTTHAAHAAGSMLTLAERPTITTGVSRVATMRRATKGEMRTVTGAEEKRARKKFAIPPAYTNVQVTDDPNAEVRATAFSPATGKTVPFHSQAFKTKRESQKWSRIANIVKDMPQIVDRVNRDIGKRPEAMTVRLVLQTGMRNGEENESGTYGASSLLMSHVVSVDGSMVHLTFPGKGGKIHDHQIHDPVLARYVQQRQASGQTTLFDHDAKATLDYLRKTARKAYRVHDLRTYVATTVAHLLLRHETKPTKKREFSQLRKRVATVVGNLLGDTPGMTAKKYIHPHVWTPFLVGA
jgi:DNA topoisomerase-1